MSNSNAFLANRFPRAKACLGLALAAAWLLTGSGLQAQQSEPQSGGIQGFGRFELDEQGRRDLEQFQNSDADRNFDAFGTNTDAVMPEFDIDAIGTIIAPDSTVPTADGQEPDGLGRRINRTLFPAPMPDGEMGADTAIVTLIPPGERKPAFRIGLISRRDAASMLAGLEAFRRSLSVKLSRPVEIFPMSNLDALIDAQALRRIDMAVYSASAYVTADQLCRCVEPLVAPASHDGGMEYYGLILSRRGSGISTVSDLDGKKVAVGPEVSVGGRIFQMASLKADGVDPDALFGEIVPAKSTVDAVLDLRDGWVDAAMAWGSLSGDRSQGYSRGTLSYLVRSGELAIEEVEIIWQSRPLTHGPIAVLKSLSTDEKDILRSFLLELKVADPEAYDWLDIVFGGGYREVTPADYRGASVLAQQSVARLGQGYAQPSPRVRPEPPPGMRSDAVPAFVEPGSRSSIDGLTQETPARIETQDPTVPLIFGAPDTSGPSEPVFLGAPNGSSASEPVILGAPNPPTESPIQ